MRLTEKEQAMLNGEMGPGFARAMRVLVGIGKAFGAERMVPISRGHISLSNQEGDLWFVSKLLEEQAHCMVPPTVNPAYDYTAFSGMWGVALTDVIQLIVIFIGVPLTTFIGLIKIGGWSGLVEKLSTMNVPGGIDTYMSPTGIGLAAMASIALPMIAYEIIGQDFYQRLLSAKNERIAKTGCIIAGCILMAMGVNSAIDGMLARAFLGDTLTEVSAIASLAVEVLPTVAAGIVIAALCAAVMSTADSLLLACTSHVVNDIYLGAMGKSASDEKSSKTILRMSVVTTVVVGIASLFVALAIPGIIEILDYAYTFYASGLVAPVLLGLFWKKGNALAAVSSIVVGGVVSLLCVFGILPIPVDAIIVGMSASFIDYVVVALVTGKKEG